MTKSNTQTPGRSHIDRLLVILLLPGLFCALYLAANRYKVESRNRAVELTLDYGELQNLSTSSGLPMPTLLNRLKDKGVIGVSVSEQTIGDMIATGQLRSRPAKKAGTVSFDVLSERPDDVRQALTARYGAIITGTTGKSPVLDIAAPPATANLMGVGLPSEKVNSIRAAGLDVVARLLNTPVMTTRAIDASIADLKKDKVERVIFSGEEVLGFRGLVKYAAEKMQSEGILYGSIEFGKQKGDGTMSEKLKSNFIRVHSISSAEMAGLQPAEMAERFSRAAKERNIRLCYVRLPELVSENPVENAEAFVSRVAEEITSAHYGLGPAHTFSEVSRPRPMLIFIGLAIVAGLLLLLDALISIPAGWKYGLLVIGYVLAVPLASVEKGDQLLAFMSALVFPTLGVVALIGPYFSAKTATKSPAKKTAALFLGTSIVSLLGALFIVGLLADKSYMVKVNQFMGIKAAHGLPLLAVVLFMAAGLPILGKPLPEVWKSISESIRKIVNHPLFVWHVIAVVFAIVIVGFALMRTGNDSGIGVSGLELKFRAVLDRLMMVRPRTKEFLIGHPALFLGIAFLLKQRRLLGLPLVALGILGQVSLVNTFCHIHTPLLMSVIRAFNGLALGLVIGWLVWIVIEKTALAEKA
ncbi:MAG TPA: DUF5693 family protein [Armatimonadota bacterium]